MDFKYFEKISDKALLKDLVRVSKLLNKKYVSTTEYNIHGCYSDSTVKERFGGWNKAIIAAGLKVCNFGKIPKQLLLRNLEKIWKSLGRLPQKRDMKRHLSQYSATAYRNNFGKWSIAIKELNKFVKNKKRYLIRLKENEKIQSFKLNKAVLYKKKKHSRNINYRTRYLILTRDRYKCRACGASPSDDRHVKLEIDHIIPWSKGGDSTIDNLQTLCSRCNNGKGDYV